MRRQSHGGEVFAASRMLSMPPDAILDMSASLNPLGMPQSVGRAIRAALPHAVHYPERDAHALSEVLSASLGIPRGRMLCGNGSTELIYLAVRALQPARILIPSPTFSEYEKAVAAAQTTAPVARECTIDDFPLKEQNGFRLNASEFIAAMEKMTSRSVDGDQRSASSVAFLCNPNNPTGTVTPRKEMLHIARAAEKNRCYLVVDEAFIDFCPEHAIIVKTLDNPYVIVLRSMTKFYALAGLRLGFGIFPTPVRKKIGDIREPWSVNSLAQAAGLAALADNAYQMRTYRLIAEEKRFLEDHFRAMDIGFVPSCANFYLLKMRNAKAVMDSLFHKGILVRNCRDFRGLSANHMRIAVRSRRENMRFIKELARCMES
ncbi:MAG TPA: threonine-phosphate decarboxylase CobD [Dissulfurispiraceae bacterium]|nr:threonine-phosphate decarboxylase CobD [Dissulfurispiraceae bacterium]